MALVGKILADSWLKLFIVDAWAAVVKRRLTLQSASLTIVVGLGQNLWCVVVVHVVAVERATANVARLGRHAEAALTLGALLVILSRGFKISYKFNCYWVSFTHILGGQAGILIGIRVETGRRCCCLIERLLHVEQEATPRKMIRDQTTGHGEQHHDQDDNGHSSARCTLNFY